MHVNLSRYWSEDRYLRRFLGHLHQSGPRRTFESFVTATLNSLSLDSPPSNLNDAVSGTIDLALFATRRAGQVALATLRYPPAMG